MDSQGPTITPPDLTGMSDGTVLLLFKDACTRLGELEQKKFFAALYGIPFEVPQVVVDQVDYYGAEVFKRMQG